MAENQKKVLFADDEDAIRDVYKLKFEKEPFNAIFAKDGNEAFEKIYQEKPDLILLDIMMPGKDGMEILKEIKQDPKVSYIPVVMLTVLSDEDIMQKAFDYGAKYYLVKSRVVPPEVVETIKKELYRDEL